MLTRLFGLIWVMALMSILVLAGTVSHGIDSKAGGFPASPPYSANFAQIVVGPNFTSGLSFGNKGELDCFLTVGIHQGAGVIPQAPILVDGQNRGPSFSDVVPAGGSLDYELTRPQNVTETFQGAVKFEVYNSTCAASVSASSNYRVSDGSGQLVENFSGPPSQRAQLGACATAVIQYDPDSSDGRTSIPGVATVSSSPLNGVQVCTDFRNSLGDYPYPTQCSDYTGGHQTELFYEAFPDVQDSVEGTWITCLQGNRPDQSTSPAAIDVTYIGILQEGQQVQYGSLAQSGESLFCVPGPARACLHDDRFAVEAQWRSSVASGAAEVGRVTEDTVLLFPGGNTELVVNILNACNTASNHFWVFAAGSTNVEVTLSVTDTQTGNNRTYTNSLGNNFQPILDTQAFATCP